MKEVQGENWHSSWQHQNNIQEPIQFCIETCPSSLDCHWWRWDGRVYSYDLDSEERL